MTGKKKSGERGGMEQVEQRLVRGIDDGVRVNWRGSAVVDKERKRAVVGKLKIIWVGSHLDDGEQRKRWEGKL